MKSALLASAALLYATVAYPQALTTQIAGPNIPPGQTLAPSNPGGMVIAGKNIWIGDANQGIRALLPTDAANPDPVNTGTLVFDSNEDGKSVGGGTACIPYCAVAQMVYDGQQTIFAAVRDKATGQPFSIKSPGINRVQIDPVDGFVASSMELAIRANLGGNQTTAVQLGPDKRLYVGFEKNGNIVVIPDPYAIDNLNQAVVSFGSSPNGRPIRALQFVGGNLWVATDQSLSVIKNATACVNNTGGCGNAVIVNDGFVGSDHVGLTSDGIDKLYFAVNGVGVFRWTISLQAKAQITTSMITPLGVASPLAFVGGHTNLLNLIDGDLFIGDDPTDGNLPFNGRVARILAADLLAVQ